ALRFETSIEPGALNAMLDGPFRLPPVIVASSAPAALNLRMLLAVKFATNSDPSEANVIPAGPLSPLPVANTLTNAPVVPLNSRIWLFAELETNRSPLGPNARPVGPVSPLPEANAVMNAPVVPLYSSTLFEPKLLTNRFPL